jgi:hypothetical protein
VRPRWCSATATVSSNRAGASHRALAADGDHQGDRRTAARPASAPRRRREHRWGVLLSLCDPCHMRFLSAIGPLFRSSHREQANRQERRHEASHRRSRRRLCRGLRGRESGPPAVPGGHRDHRGQRRAGLRPAAAAAPARGRPGDRGSEARRRLRGHGDTAAPGPCHHCRPRAPGRRCGRRRRRRRTRLRHASLRARQPRRRPRRPRRGRARLQRRRPALGAAPARAPGQPGQAG